MNLSDSEVIQLQDFLARLSPQSDTYLNITGQTPAPIAWTPALTFATPGDLTVAYTTQWGAYTKWGNDITLHFVIETSTFTHTTAASNLRVTGIPFASNADTTARYIGKLEWGGITKANYTEINCRLAGGSSTTMQFVASGSAQAAAFVTAADMPSAGTVVLRGTLHYCT